MTPDEKIKRANEARQLLQNEYLREAFDAIEREAIEDMLSAPRFLRIGDRKRRLAAERVRVIRDVRQALTTVVTEGEQAGRRRPAVA